jgi:ADP-ribose pyrophosphatase YjhB (NUDIX family)
MNTVVKTHIGSYGIIIKDEKIALIKKARGGYKGKLDLPGGGIEHTETPEETLIRELQEEADVTVVNKELFGVTSTNIIWQMTEDTEEDLHHIGILYKVEIKEEKLKDSPDFLDSEGCNWYDIKTLNKDDLSPFAKYVIENIKY